VIPLSKDLFELYQAYVKKDEDALEKFAPKKPDEMTDEELLLLADVIEFYFSMAPRAAPNVDGLKHSDRAALATVAKMIRAYKGSAPRDAAIPKGMPLGSPLEKVTVNATPPGRLPWEILAVDEEVGGITWGLHLTGGKAKDPWRNALLSNAAKMLMYRAYKSDPKKYSPATLAEIFRVREQRVLAILRLKAEAEADPVSKEPKAKEIRKLMEHVLQAKKAIGSGERHIVEIPSYPAYAKVQEKDIISGLEKVLGKSANDIKPEEITREVAHKAVGIKPVEEIEEEVAARQEKGLVEEFRLKLDYNLGLVATTISRDSRRTKAPTRPKEGWSLVVNPVGKETKAKHQVYVAQPDGSRRELTEDEKFYIERKKPRPRRKII